MGVLNCELLSNGETEIVAHLTVESWNSDVKGGGGRERDCIVNGVGMNYYALPHRFLFCAKLSP
jgi:hypothetical protein